MSLLVAIGLGRADRLAGTLGWRPLASVGAFSYSMYLVHAQLLQVFWQTVVDPLSLDRPAQLVLGWALGVPLIIAASYGFSLLAERPFVRRETRMKARMRAGMKPMGGSLDPDPISR
ncbi:peptidoglycan/LPS O-acetylase OafA/YrhL [Mycetocola sp. CAN_C7]